VPDDPLDDIYALPKDQQMLVIISVVRMTRSSQERIEKKVDWVLRAFVGLIVSLLVVAVTIKFGSHAQPAPHREGTAGDSEREMRYGPVLLIAAMLTGLLIAYAVLDRSQATARDNARRAQETARQVRERKRTDARICFAVNKLDNVIVALLERSQKTLATQPYYREHPELLPAARRQNARALGKFRGAAC